MRMRRRVRLGDAAASTSRSTPTSSVVGGDLRIDPQLATNEDPSDDDLLIEGDALVDALDPTITAREAGDALVLYRPLSSVTLLTVPWGEAVDHERLQDAIACGPRASASDTSLPAWLQGREVERCDDDAASGGAFVTVLCDDELTAMKAWSRRASAARFAALRRAALLPSSIVGAEEDTAAAGGAALVSYRRSALVHAMQSSLGEASQDVARERDALAINLVSTLKALLGET